jgi:hypothetical protein
VRYPLDCAIVTQHAHRSDFEWVPTKKKKATTGKTRGAKRNGYNARILAGVPCPQ